MTRADQKHRERLRALAVRLRRDPNTIRVVRTVFGWDLVWPDDHVHLDTLDPDGDGWWRWAETEQEVIAEACRALGLKG